MLKPGVPKKMCVFIKQREHECTKKNVELPVDLAQRNKNQKEFVLTPNV